MQFLFKSTHRSWKYERQCEWVFFSEHSVVRGCPGGLLQFSKGEAVKILLASVSSDTTY